MGWMNCHLHGFTISEKNTRPIAAVRIQMPNPEWDEGDEVDEGKDLREWMRLEKGDVFDPSDWVCTDVEFENPKILLKEFLRDQKLYG